MKRDLVSLTNQRYDVAIIGGGIYGATIAWDAAARGLSVALVEKADFASATSANSLKIIHGGLRYLQHGDIRRVRASSNERSTLMRIAPHLIHPLPVLLPTYGHGVMGPEVMSLALGINDLIGFDRNRQLDAQHRIPRGRVLSRRECLAIAPGLDSDKLTGAVLFYDAQVYNSERLVLAFLHSAAEAGAQVANYVEAVDYLKTNQRITGILARDTLTDSEFAIEARIVVNAGGPWSVRQLHEVKGDSPHPPTLAKAVNIVTRPLFDQYAVGIPCRQRYRDTDAVLDKGMRFLFTAPWRGHSLIGTTYSLHSGPPDTFQITEQDIVVLLDQVNHSYPCAQLHLDDVTFVHGGLVPTTGVDSVTGDVQLTKHHQIVDGARFGLDGLFLLVGVKYTSARQVAEQVVDQIFRRWGQRSRPCPTAKRPVHGGDMANFTAFRSAAIEHQLRGGLDNQEFEQLLMNYGSVYKNVLRYANLNNKTEGVFAKASSSTAILDAQVRYSIHEEMAQRLSDVVLRRTELGTAQRPDHALLVHCADIMGDELGWSTARIRQEIEQVSTVFTWRRAYAALTA